MEEELQSSITALEDAIELFRGYNKMLHEESNYFWTEDIGQISDTIRLLLAAKETLQKELDAQKELSDEIKMRKAFIERALNESLYDIREWGKL